MGLWFEWFRCVQQLRPACSRHRTFLWMTLALAGLCIRNDLAGVTSLVRVLGLRGRCYRCFLNLLHSSGLKQTALESCWTQAVVKLFTPFRLEGRLVLIADGLKVAKEGLKMPAVKKTVPEFVQQLQTQLHFWPFVASLRLVGQRPPGPLVWCAVVQPDPRGCGVFQPR